MQPRTPPLYATGRWVVDTPYKVAGTAIYTCKAIRSFDDLKARGIDPYKEFYELQGISQEDYEIDARNLANIVTLMSDTQPTVYVPDTYIRSFPDITTVPYRHIVLSISMGAVPDTLSLDDFKTKTQEYALASLGINVQVKEHQAGALSEGVDQISHQSLENNRLAKIENNNTTWADLVRKDAELEKLREQNRILVQLCVDNGLLD